MMGHSHEGRPHSHRAARTRAARHGFSAGHRVASTLGAIGLTSAAALAAAPIALGAAPTPGSGAPGAPASAPCSLTADACVSLSRDQAWLVHDGRVLQGPVPSSHGSDAEPTPTGTFAVQWKDADHVSSEGAGGPMPWAVFFDTHGRALHGGSTTRNSVGCVHLSPQDAKTFFEALDPGDEVQILP